MACWWAAGNSLGLFFGGLFIVTFLAPAASLRSAANYLVVVSPVALIWLLPLFQTPDTATQWLQSIIALFTYSLAIAGIALILARLKFPKVFAAAITIAIGLAWLTWPIWLSPILVKNGADQTVANLVHIHPPFAINGILTNEPAWTERSIAYHLTTLNQDIPIRLPESIWSCAAVHGLIGLAFWMIAKWGMAKRV